MYAEKNGITASTAGKKLLKAYKAGLLDRLSRVLLTGGTEYVFYPKGVLDVEDSGKSS
jgi:predicted transcriptional regulator